MLAIRADLLDFTAAPAWGDTGLHGVRWRADHWLLVGDDGRIAAVQAHDPGPAWPRSEHPGRLLMPGFIDTHAHAPQLRVMASHGTALLDWLHTYTFPAELRWADPAVAAAACAQFLDALLAHGTTAAVVFPTVHAAGVDALFEAAAGRGMRLIAGKVLMDRHAPAGLLDDADPAIALCQCEQLIERWHGHGRNAYAVTVRFAPTSTPAQLAMAGALCRADTTLYMQTHLAENRAETAWVAELFPHARSYLGVYAEQGLLHARSVLAHGIWLDDTDRALLHERGAHIAFCPSSNMFLGSGLFDWHGAERAGVQVSVASDVGGGTSLNMQRTLADAYRVQALRAGLADDEDEDEALGLTAWHALHAATRGAAQALRLGHEIGTLEPGLVADLCLWDMSASAVDAQRQACAGSLHERMFAWMLLSDERHLVRAWVAGNERYARAAA